MRLLFLTQFFDPEPGAIRGLPLARWLARRGHAVRVVTGFPNYPGGRLYPGYRLRWRRWEVRDGVAVLRVPLYPSHSRSAVGRIANYTSFALAASTIGLALAGPADVAYVYHPPATVGLPGLVLKALRGLPMVYHIADMWPESVVHSGMAGHGLCRAALARMISSWCAVVYRASDAITVLSPGFRRMLAERGVPGEKISVIYNWADDVFQPLARDDRLAVELGLAGRFNVLYAGNLGAFQGLETVIRAAALLKEYPQIQLVLAGTGQHELALRNLARQTAAPVLFLGARPYGEMPRINALADVLLVHLKDLPFFAHTIPSKTQVALASGRPVLMAVRGDAAELVARAGAGLLCEPENPQALAAAVLEFFRMPEEQREAMGRRGREFYLREMSLDLAGQRMEELFGQVARKKAPAASAVAHGEQQ